jgi:hypothetical protein
MKKIILLLPDTGLSVKTTKILILIMFLSAAFQTINFLFLKDNPTQLELISGYILLPASLFFLFQLITELSPKSKLASSIIINSQSISIKPGLLKKRKYIDLHQIQQVEVRSYTVTIKAVSNQESFKLHIGRDRMQEVKDTLQKLAREYSFNYNGNTIQKST